MVVDEILIEKEIRPCFPPQQYIYLKAPQGTNRFLSVSESLHCPQVICRSSEDGTVGSEIHFVFNKYILLWNKVLYVFLPDMYLCTLSIN